MSANTLNEVVQTYRESCLTKALSTWMSLASIKYLEDIQVTLEVKQRGRLRKELLPKLFNLLQVLRKDGE